MSEYWKHTQGGVRFGAFTPLRPADTKKIAGLLCFSHDKQPLPPLQGRSGKIRLDLTDRGSVVIKHYLRGGALARINRRKYFGIGKSRAQQEYAWLHRVRSIGISAPEPIAFARTTGFVHETWLITREIDAARSLLEAAIGPEEKTRIIMKQIVLEIGKLIRAGIFHVDLHPGNILLDGRSVPYIIDFDKTRRYRGTHEKLAKKYIHRWNRAVIKHGLPRILSESFSAGIQSFIDNSGETGVG